MNKRRLTEYAAIIPLCLFLVFAYYRVWWVSAVLYLVWYFLYGFVGLAYAVNTKRMLKLSNFFLAITAPYILLPFRKAFYYWTKAVNVTQKSPDNIEATKKAFELSQKVNVDSLYTDKNKAVFLLFRAALYLDLNDKEAARKYLDKARLLTHNKQTNEILERLEELYSAMSE